MSNKHKNKHYHYTEKFRREAVKRVEDYHLKYNAS